MHYLVLPPLYVSPLFLAYECHVLFVDGDRQAYRSLLTGRVICRHCRPSSPVDRRPNGRLASGDVSLSGGGAALVSFSWQSAVAKPGSIVVVRNNNEDDDDGIDD